MMCDRNGVVNACYGHADNSITAIREAIAAAVSA
jgi:ribosomal protein S5